MNSPASTASSTFWLIDTTSVSGTFTTTATFTLWVPLYTTSTPAASSSAVNDSAGSGPNAGVVAGAVVGTLLGLSLVIVLFILFRRRTRIHRVKPRIKPGTPQSGSTHGLIDLAAEPGPHPENIEPWIAPGLVRRPTKAEEAASQAQTSHRAEALNTIPMEPMTTPEPQDSVPGPSQPRLQLHPTSSDKSVTPQPRRRAREPSPPRLEQDAGVSLLRAGDDVLPPSYGDLIHDRP